MYFRTADKMKISDKLAIRRGGGGGGHPTDISATFLLEDKKLYFLEHLSTP